MKIAVEISMYPMTTEYLPAIQGFIDRVKANERLDVLVNTMSTQILGELDEVFGTLQREMRAQMVFVACVLLWQVGGSQEVDMGRRAIGDDAIRAGANADSAVSFERHIHEEFLGLV